MRVAIVHYHLEPGGVTRVIEATSSALTKSGIDHVILTGSENSDLPHRMVDGLGYLTGPSETTAASLIESLLSAATDALGGPPDIWHFHNHSLGKNRLLPAVVDQLARDGQRLVLHLHDLPEQGRPANYAAISEPAKLYPVTPRVRYVFLNSRDLTTFQDAGLPAENAVFLPNPISIEVPHPAPAGGDGPLLFAPVRGIRRKNLGELVLLSALAPSGTRIGVSREPRNPDALPIHENWRKFAARHRFPIGFGVVENFSPAAGASASYQSWLSHATHIVTTSVAEGFGLPFLESVALSKSLLGRNLRHLTDDHASHGINAGRLYDHILVPVEWVDAKILRDHLVTDLERNFRAYGRPLTSETVADTFDVLTKEGWLDFGNLPEPLQQGVIERLAETANRRVPLVEVDGKTEPLVDWLAAAISENTPSAAPEQLSPYSPENYITSLAEIYQDLSTQPLGPISYLNADEILTGQLAPSSFHFLLSALKPAPPPVAFRAVVFDVYGTLLIAPAGGVKPDPFADPVLRDILRRFGHEPPASPSTALQEAICRHHAAAGEDFPEVDLRVIWREVLGLPPDADTTPLVLACEEAWHPVRPMPGAEAFVRRLARSGISLGLLSNAQCNTLSSLGGLADLFPPELTIFSYQQGMAKPAPALFELMAERLAGRGISPAETLFIGNDPLHDIVPAAAAGFRTALFSGHPDSLRDGECTPDYRFRNWRELPAFT